MVSALIAGGFLAAFFKTSKLQNFKTSKLQNFKTSKLRALVS